MLCLVWVLVAGCSGGTEAPLRDVDAVKQDQQAREDAEIDDRAQRIELGESIELSGVDLVVTGFSILQTDFDDPAMTAQVRTENRSGEDLANPQLEVVCDDYPGEHGGPLAYSTWLPSESLPAGSFDEGDLFFIFPTNLGSGEPVPPCENPRVRFLVRAAMWVGDEPAPAVAEIAVPQAVIDDYTRQLGE